MATESSDTNAGSNKLSNGAPPGSGPRKATSMFNSVKRELYQLAHPYYIINLILGLSFLCLRLIPPVCYYVFGNSGGKLNKLSLTIGHFFKRLYSELKHY